MQTMNVVMEVLGDRTGASRLMENVYVRELCTLLEENDRDYSWLLSLIGYVEDMETLAWNNTERFNDLKRQLDEMKEIQSHPIKNALHVTASKLESGAQAIDSKIWDLKTSIIEGCKSAIAAFKEKGIAALDNITSFFHIKSGLQSLGQAINAEINRCDSALGQIESFSREYHSAGSHIKNMGRVLAGKEKSETVKESGKIAWTIGAPFRAFKACLVPMANLVKKMIAGLERLEQRAAAIHESRDPEEKTSKIQQLRDKQEAIGKEEKAKPVRARIHGLEELEI